MTTPRKNSENFIATVVDDEVVLIDMAGGELFSLKNTARSIWDLVDGQKSLAEIVAAIVGEYDVDTTEAEADVRLLLEELESAGLVTC